MIACCCPVQADPAFPALIELVTPISLNDKPNSQYISSKETHMLTTLVQRSHISNPTFGIYLGNVQRRK